MSRRARLRRLATLGGAVAAQLSQALLSFGLQAIVARTLGATGLGTFALLFSVIVTSSALAGGLVGDSLTVLDRRAGPVRAALQRWAVLSCTSASVVTALALVLAGAVDPVSGVVFVAASVTFLVEGLVRRVLMAGLRFWSVVVVDAASLAASLVVLAVWAATSTLSLDAMLVALAVGQVAGALAGIPLLPAEERWWSRSPAAMREVWAYGSLRAVQQSIRPLLLTLVRVLVVLEAGREAFGRLEAARIYVAPGVLVIQGLGTYLFASYARDRASPLPALVRRADRTASMMALGALVVGGLAAALTGTLGSVVTGASFSIDPVDVLGWTAFAAATAANAPYASLAAVRARQGAVIRNAIVIALGTLVISAVLVLAGAPLVVVPVAIGAGLLLQGAVLRNRILPRSEQEPALEPDAELR
ncbi:hypothetical protein [Nocardioides dongxiaopingii]|uniref:hypothetical protein n=1 Tax=Nocardioides dongxiaopingii TaxID=2576036 RepID=UPI0010C7679F|nr:hypothetical protein [Nocardioides dongxiaopingii]